MTQVTSEQKHDKWELDALIADAERQERIEAQFFNMWEAHQRGQLIDLKALESMGRYIFDDEIWESDFSWRLLRRKSPVRRTRNKNLKTQVANYFSGKDFNPVRFAQDILAKHLIMFCDGQRLYWYDNGVYRPDGEAKFQSIAQDLLAEEWRQRHVDESLKWARQKLRVEDKEQINPDDGLINVKNGLLNWRTGELISHTPDRFSTVQLPVDYNPDANDPVVMKFMRDVIPEDTIDTVLEMIGYCLIPSTRYEKAIMLYGKGGNGKSKLINMICALIGRSAVSNVSLHDIENNRFKIAELQDKLINACADLPNKPLSTTSNFKAIVSGDALNAERKNKDPFNYRPFAKLIFSTNQLPRSFDLSDGYFRRWLIIPFDRKFSAQEADTELDAKLSTPSALSTLLNYVIQGLRRLEDRGGFEDTESIQRTLAQYKLENDNVAYFVQEKCIVGNEQTCLTKVMYEAYKKFCIENGLRPLGNINFGKHLTDLYNVDNSKRHKGDSSKHWSGIGLNARYRE